MPPEGELRAAIVQDAASGRVLMLAWMDDEAERRTRETRRGVVLEPLARGVLAQGRDLGNTLAVEELRDDCDGDALLLRVSAGRPRLPHGLALVLRAGALAHDRRSARSSARAGSLHDDGCSRRARPAVARKVGEEAVEVVTAALAESDERRRLGGGRPRLPPLRPARLARDRPRRGRGRARRSRALRPRPAALEEARLPEEQREQRLLRRAGGSRPRPRRPAAWP